MVLLSITKKENVIEINNDKFLDMLSKYVVQESLNMAGEFQMPTGITVNSKWPHFVLNAVFSILRGSILIW